MKKSCKNIDITNWEICYPWVLECLQRHRKRHDFERLLRSAGGMAREEYEAAREDKQLIREPAVRITKEAVRRIIARDLDLPPVRIQKRKDKSSLKLRDIGCEDAMQQVFDYIAVKAAEPIWKRRIVPQQASSIKGRGPSYGTKMISRWVQKDQKAARWAQRNGVRYSRKCRKFVKLDIQKCFPSMRVERFMEHFQRDCGNEDLLWLWEALLKSHCVEGYLGFMIGALPSQWAVQYITSFLYRHIMELHSRRRGKHIPWVRHCEIYMDDLLLLGSNYEHLKRAAQETTRYARQEFGLTIKSSWQICNLDETPIDIMGYVIHMDGAVTVRERIFLRARRIAGRIKRHGTISVRQAKRLISYKGYFAENAFHADRKYDLKSAFQRAANLISRIQKQKGMIFA